MKKKWEKAVINVLEIDATKHTAYCLGGINLDTRQDMGPCTDPGGISNQYYVQGDYNTLANDPGFIVWSTKHQASCTYGYDLNMVYRRDPS